MVHGVRAPLCSHRVPASEPLQPSDRTPSASHQLRHIKSESSASILTEAVTCLTSSVLLLGSAYSSPGQGQHLLSFL